MVRVTSLNSLLAKFFILFCMTNHVFAETCFIIKQKDKIIQQEGDGTARYAPCSTFKIALSLMGYDSGYLIDKMHPLWSFKKGYPDFLEAWKKDQTPTSWIKNSCVWYSQVLTNKLGMQHFQSYIVKLRYGNMDLSGDKGKDNGLTNAWLSSSLEISGMEQILFLEKLINCNFPISKYAQETTKTILFVEKLGGGWKLYGKTGNGFLLSPDRTSKLKIQHGWFVGWIEKDQDVIIFSNHIADDKPQDTFASQRAKQLAKKRLIQLINDSNT